MLTVGGTDSRCVYGQDLAGQVQPSRELLHLDVGGCPVGEGHPTSHTDQTHLSITQGVQGGSLPCHHFGVGQQDCRDLHVLVDFSGSIYDSPTTAPHISVVDTLTKQLFVLFC